LAPDETNSAQQISAAVQEVSERAQVIIREEIELAKVEITEKVSKIVRGAVIGAVAGVFALGALVLLLHGVAWLIYYIIPFGNQFEVFWGYFIAALLFLILGALAGLIAARTIKKGTPPKPEMAIEEAQRIKQTVRG
jgi:uncharacterized membrane protein YqjE